MLKINLFFLFFPLLYFSQVKDDTVISPHINRLILTKTPDAEKTYQVGVEILRYSKTKSEIMWGYGLVADGNYKKQRYTQAIAYYKKADSLARLVNDKKMVFMTNLYMAGIYRRIGLLSIAQEKHNEVQKVAATIRDKYPSYMAAQQKATFLEMDSKFREAIDIRKVLVENDEKKVLNNPSDKDVIQLLVNSYSWLAYDYYKCDQKDLGAKYLEKADRLVNKANKEEIVTISVYYMVKGIASILDLNPTLSKYWFDKALFFATKRNSRIQLLQVLEQRLYYGVDKASKRIEYSRQYDAIKQWNKIEAGQIIEQEEKVKNNIIKKKDQFLH